MALSVGLDSAVKALRAHQLAVDVASHNIANAQSPGFSRQRALLRPDGLSGADRYSHDALIGKAGSGVTAQEVSRVRDLFLDYQARQTSSSKSEYEAFSTALGRAELTFNEPSDDGIASLIGKFFNAWHDVVNDPESMAGRVALVHATTTLTANIQRAANDLDVLRTDVNRDVVSLAEEINSRAAEIASLNQQIVQVEANGDMANDLRDRRDLLLDQLATIGQITYSETANHAVSVYLGSHELVSQSLYHSVQAVNDSANPGMDKLVFVNDQMDVLSNTGRLRGLLDVRDIALPELAGKLDTFASELIAQVNTLHSAGFGLDGSTTLSFFAGTDAHTIALNAALAASPQQIAASSTAGTVGNSANALAIADLQRTPSLALGSNTFDQFYGSMVSILGSDVSRSEGLAASSDLLNSHIEAQRQGVMGVNLDEEITAMNASQHAYQAASRVISTIDEMLDTLINRTGLAGR